MKRRKFLINSTLTSSALMSLNYSFSNQKAKPKYNFNLKYAPHLGMFVNHAGKDPLNQLKFMYEQGFTAFIDCYDFKYCRKYDAIPSAGPSLASYLPPLTP